MPSTTTLFDITSSCNKQTETAPAMAMATATGTAAITVGESTGDDAATQQTTSAKPPMPETETTPVMEAATARATATRCGYVTSLGLTSDGDGSDIVDEDITNNDKHMQLSSLGLASYCDGDRDGIADGRHHRR
ncbi:hypothetical protein VPH35_045035 [Triticum aestivum]